MNRIWTALVTSALGATACAQGADLLYAPARPIADQGIVLKAWGSGTASQTDETAYAGSFSIRMSTRNLYQGGIIDYAKARDLTQQFGDKNNLLRLTFRLADSSAMGFGGTTGRGPMGGAPMGGAPMGGGPMGGGPMGGGVRGGAMGGGVRGGAMGGGVRGGAGGGKDQGGPMGGGPMGGGPMGGQYGGPMGGSARGTTSELSLKTVRLIVTTSDGKKSEVFLPANTSLSGENGWRTISVPLQGIRGFERTNKMVQSIAISGDSTATFYVGDLRVVNDSTQIRGSIQGPATMNLALGDTITFSANGNGGSSILKYTWDFDSSDGIQVDAEGRTIQRRFRKAGDFVVTLTISDYYGLKAPYQASVKVKVNP